MASSSSGVGRTASQVSNSDLSPPLKSRKDIINAVQSIVKAIGFSKAFGVLDLSQEPGKKIRGFLEKPLFAKKLLGLFKGVNGQLTLAQDQAISTLFDLTNLEVLKELKNEFGFLPDLCRKILKDCNVSDLKSPLTAFNFHEEVSVLCKQLVKLSTDGVQYQFPDCFKVFLLAYGACMFFHKAKLNLPISTFKLTPEFYVSAEIAPHVSRLILSLSCSLPESLAGYASRCFLKDCENNSLEQKEFKKSKAYQSKKLSGLDCFSIEKNSTFLLILSSLPILFSGLRFCTQAALPTIKSIGYSSEHIDKACQFFGESLSGYFSGFSIFARGIDDPERFIFRLVEFQSAYPVIVNELLACPVHIQGVGVMSLTKALLENKETMIDFAALSGPVFYPLFMQAVLGNSNTDIDRINLDKSLIAAIGCNIINNSFMPWMNAMFKCGLVSLSKDTVQLSHNSWNHGESVSFVLTVGIKISDLTDQQIGALSEHRSVFVDKYKNCLFKVICSSGSVFDLVNNRSDLIAENKISLFVSHSGCKEEITMSIDNLPLINEVFSVVADKDLIVRAVVNSLKNPELTLEVRQSCIKQVDGMRYVKPMVINEQDSYSYAIDVGFLSSNLMERLSMDDGEKLIYPQISVQLILNEKAASLDFQRLDNLASFLQENTLLFIVCDESDLKKPLFHTVPLNIIPDCLFEKLVNFIQIYPFFPTISPADKFPLMLSLAPSSAQVFDTSVQQTSNSVPLMSTFSTQQLLQTWRLFDRAAQVLFFAACTVPQQKFIVGTLTAKQFQGLSRNLLQDQKQSLRVFLSSEAQQELGQMVSNQNSPAIKSSTKPNGKSSKGKPTLRH